MRAFELALCAMVAMAAGCAASKPPDREPDARHGDASDAGAQMDDRRFGDEPRFHAGAGNVLPGFDSAPTDWPAGGYELVSFGCELDPIGEGFELVPWSICEWSPIGDRLLCSRARAIECFRAEDCTAEPFGRCVGTTHTHCTYPYEPSTCTVDGDCTALPQGVCRPAASAELRCDEQGHQCVAEQAHCHYRVLDQVCDADEGCNAAPGGTCMRAVVRTLCLYLGCEDDLDCAADQACVCHACVSAECRSDDQCGPGEICRRENACGWGPNGGFHCTKPGDECRSDEDCAGGAYCDYDARSARFICDTEWCEVP